MTTPRRVDAVTDRVWKALASDVRREMLDALFEGPRTTGELVMRFPELSRFAVMQHLKVLVKSRLVVVRREGRMRHNLLNPVPIQMIYERWVSRYHARWAGLLTGLKAAVEGDQDGAVGGGGLPRQAARPERAGGRVRGRGDEPGIGGRLGARLGSEP